MLIEGERVRCRAIEVEDLGLLMKWHNDPAIARMLVGWSFPLSMAGQKPWFERSLSDTSTRRFIVETLDTARPIGMTGLREIDWKNRSAQTALLIGENCRGQGYGTDAIMAIMRYAFLELGLNRLWSEILEYNRASYRAYVEKCGWKVEGKLRESVYREGRFHDTYRVAVLRSEYLALAGARAPGHRASGDETGGGNVS